MKFVSDKLFKPGQIIIPWQSLLIYSNDILVIITCNIQLCCDVLNKSLALAYPRNLEIT